MSSAAVYQALTADPELNALGIDEDGVFSDYTLESAPRDGRFIIMRWGTQSYRAVAQTGPTNMVLWVHQAEELGSDFTEINKIHHRVREVLVGMEQVLGVDGVKVTSVEFDGLGGNLRDPGFHTITKNAGYRVLLHPVW